MTERKKQALRERIIEARARLMNETPMWSILLMYMNFIASNTVKNVSVNGTSIIFSPSFLEKLRTEELDFVLCHLLFHVLFDDIYRDISLKGESYHHACDIVINSALVKSGFTKDRYPHLGRIFNKLNGYSLENSKVTADAVYRMLPYKISSFAEYVREGFFFDTDKYWELEDRDIPDGILILEREDNDPINIIKESAKEEFESTSGGKDEKDDPGHNDDSEDSEETGEAEGEEETDDECVGEKSASDEKSALQSDCKEDWKKRYEAINAQFLSLSRENAEHGYVPLRLKRELAPVGKSVIDWRKLLIRFVSEQINDYSFFPPDRRYSEYDFFLPDFNEVEYEVKDIWFMVDTSGSMDREMLAAAYSEIYGAVEQFAGKIKGKIGFFDTEVKSIHEFCTKNELKKILPVGGGGTDFHAPFDYIIEKGITELPKAMVIFTDGEGPYPYKSETMGIPVMWLLTSCYSTPPFGKIIRVSRK